MATKSQETATTVKTGEKPEKPILKDLDPAPVISEKIKEPAQITLEEATSSKKAEKSVLKKDPAAVSNEKTKK